MPILQSPTDPHLLYFFLRKEHVSKRQQSNRIKHSTRQKSSHGGWTRQPNSKKSVSRVKETEQHLLPLLEQYQWGNNQNTYTESLVQTLRGSELSASVSVSPCEPWLAEWFGHVLMVSSNPSDAYKLSSPSSTGFLHLKGRDKPFRLFSLHNILWIPAPATICCMMKHLWWYLGKAQIYECSRILLESFHCFSFLSIFFGGGVYLFLFFCSTLVLWSTHLLVPGYPGSIGH